MLMVPNVITIDDAAVIAGVPRALIVRVVTEGEMLPVARMLTATGAWEPLYTVSAITKGLVEISDKVAG